MAKRRPARERDAAADTPDGLPDRDALLAFIRDSKNAVTLRDVQRALGFRSAARRRVQDVLNQLAGEGAIERIRGQIYRARRRLPEVAVIEITRIDADGDVFGKIAERGAADEGLELLVVAGRHAPSRGDRVLARLSVREGGEPRALVLRPLERTAEFVVGVFEGEHRGGGTIRPADRRLRDHPVVAAADRGGAEHGELVRAELVRDRPFGPPRARIVERLGPAYGPRAASLIVVHQHGIPVEFPAEARAEAERARPVELGDDGAGRRADLRDLPLVTIDGADARDFDDAVFAAPDGDPNNKGGWRLTVAIADVAHYVRPGSALDRAARERGNSVYFPDRVVPMLPEELSNDLCSLRPHEDRACLAAHMRIDSGGEMFEHRFERGLMRSAARLTYEQAQRAAEGAPDDVTGPLLERAIRPLYGAYAALAAARARRHVLELDLPERKIELDTEGRVVRIATPPRLDSHRLIEEYMILANVAAAEALEAMRQPCMYRIHEPPDLSKLEALRPVLKELGAALPPQGLSARDFNRVIAQTRESPHKRMVHELILRAQSQAQYNPVNRGHFGLALRRYAHFTSPIRRYADLLVHRALLGPGVPGGIGRPDAAGWADLGEAISKAERRAMAAERDANHRYIAAFLADRVGAEFEGTVNGVQRFGLFVTLDETGADGLLPVGALPRDYYRHDPERHALVGRATGRAFHLGDAVTVRLEEADAVTGSLAFGFVAHAPARDFSRAPGFRGTRRPRRRH
ncbi:MAG: ribonuclease R [Alphaproteobacteria bacterium]